MLHFGTSSISGGSDCPAVRRAIAAQATMAALSWGRREGMVTNEAAAHTCAQRGRRIDKFHIFVPVLV